MPNFLNRWLDAFRLVRRALKARLPYVRRREFRILRRKHDGLIDAFTARPRHASDARIHAFKPLEASPVGDVCLFVTHGTTPELKPHVQFHVECLVGAGFQVVLMVNTDLKASSIAIERSFGDLLTAAYVRENVGFDFAAWGHAYAIGNGFPGCTRLLLVNDSIVGPLRVADFAAVVSRLRESKADVVGLTENTEPYRHLQSFFLAFGQRALASEVMRQVFSGMRALPTKDLVVDVYETALTRQLVSSGLEIEALFPPMYKDRRSADDTITRWRDLVDAGFPYIKASVIRSELHSGTIRALVPAHLLPPTSNR
jgi:hypothetical protein